MQRWYMPLVLLAGAYVLLAIFDRLLPLEGARSVEPRVADRQGAILVGLISDLQKGGDETRAYLLPCRLLSGRGIVVRRQAGVVTVTETAGPVGGTAIVLLVVSAEALRRYARGRKVDGEQ